MIYFALVACVKAGVTLTDVEAQLDRRALKVRRRAGDAKAYRIEAARKHFEQLQPTAQAASGGAAAAPVEVAVDAPAVVVEETQVVAQSTEGGAAAAAAADDVVAVAVPVSEEPVTAAPELPASVASVVEDGVAEASAPTLETADAELTAPLEVAPEASGAVADDSDAALLPVDAANETGGAAEEPAADGEPALEVSADAAAGAEAEQKEAE